MVYNSLFDLVKNVSGKSGLPFDSFYEQTAYNGTLNQVLEHTESVLKRNKGSKPDYMRDALDLILFPPRIVRSVMDYKISNPSALAESLLKDSVDLCLKVYQSSNNSLRDLIDLETQIVTLDPFLLDKKLEQEEDRTTWLANNPSYSNETVNYIKSETQGGPVVFIALAHGGVSAGADVFLRYNALVGSDDSTFYSVRFSRYKQNDKRVAFSLRELDFLRNDLEEKPFLVVFDEDASTGGTLSIAEYDLLRLFPNTNIITAVNMGDTEL